MMLCSQREAVLQIYFPNVNESADVTFDVFCILMSIAHPSKMSLESCAPNAVLKDLLRQRNCAIETIWYTSVAAHHIASLVVEFERLLVEYCNWGKYA
jgi:hypothetical protein